jgi:co-chaperonin GroES (HSP10)
MSKVYGKLIPIRDGVIVSDMNFGEQQTKSGIVIKSDDGKSEGVRPRWGRVYAIGKTQKDVKVGDWILIEHGRWTRSATVVQEDGTEITVRRVEVKSIIGWSHEAPSGIELGELSSSVTEATFTPEMFAQPHY